MTRVCIKCSALQEVTREKHVCISCEHEGQNEVDFLIVDKYVKWKTSKKD